MAAGVGLTYESMMDETEELRALVESINRGGRGAKPFTNGKPSRACGKSLLPRGIGSVGARETRRLKNLPLSGRPLMDR